MVAAFDDEDDDFDGGRNFSGVDCGRWKEEASRRGGED